ncbi:methyltransferase domain-containing protein [Thiobacillus sp.]|uniref:class I SAM-dependent methyltransferase n=1 Tax=Thiobacillus sp. TaxID=924 RepID=UPI00286D8EA2|nr:methyltransferase domain-containing protein [Thiobacillus sp.]
MNADNSFSSWEEAVAWLRRQPEQSQLIADCYYDDPLIEAADRYWRSDEWAAVRELLVGRSGTALDVGAGRGIASYALAKEGLEVTALEPDPSELVGGGAIRALAAESGLPVRVVEEFSERLPFCDGTFDVVFARAVLHHTRDLQAACREFFRVLKPGGLFIAIREHVISREEDLPRFLDMHPLHKLYGGEHAYLLRQYIAAIGQSGFLHLKVISPWQSPLNYAPYSLTTLKAEVARRVGRGIPGVGLMVNSLLDLPGMWPLTRKILNQFDNRPGRLYSFVATRP